MWPNRPSQRTRPKRRAAERRRRGLPVVDRQSRNQLAEAIRALVSGQISNDEFERRVPIKSEDPAVWHLYFDGVWFLYSDLWEYRLKKKHRLPPATKEEVARWILFLKTDQPFQWPQPKVWERLLMFVGSLVTFGLAARFYRRKYQSAGEWEVWPFISRASYEEALKTPVYLHAAL